ncbi:MAG TPA: type III-A CRISPR-associated RAMP protein Csm5, partial [Candidatus Ratteibacteria bacterium]|nr:type III-A CRISPR-associated RAMP protein Csm5 [Candidatus Ratteibacteria bacterium]
MDIKERYKLKITPITPLYLGTGEEIRYFSYEDNKIVVKDVERFIKEEPEINPDEKYQIINNKETDRIKQEKYKLESLIKEKTNSIKKFVKTIDFKPYIPGTAIKGGLRTAFLSYLLKDNDINCQVKKKILKEIIPSNLKDTEADNEINRFLMGSDPQEDIFKAVTVADSNFFGIHNLKVMKIMIYNVKSNKEEWKNFSIFVEGVDCLNGILIETTLFIDTNLLKSQEQNILGQYKDKITIENIKESARYFSNSVITTEKNFYKGKKNVEQIYQFYETLLSTTLTNDEFLTPIGWGTGWTMKTIVENFNNSNDVSLKDALRKRFLLGKVICPSCYSSNMNEDRKDKKKMFCRVCKESFSKDVLKLVYPFPKTRKIVFIDNLPKY